MADGITVAVGMDSSAVNTGLSALNDKLNQTRSQINNVANSTGSLARQQREQAAASSKSGQNMLQLAYAADDAQYGMRGLMNNIPMVAQSLGLSAGLAAAASIAAVAITFLWDKLAKLGDGAKNEALKLSQAAMAVENAQARVAQAARDREKWEKVAHDQSELTTKSVKDSAHAFDQQAAALGRTNDALSARIKLDEALNTANKALEIAKVDASGDNETTKIVKKGEIEERYRLKAGALESEELKGKIDSAKKQLELQEQIQKKANETSDKRAQAARNLADAEKRADDAKLESEKTKLKAIRLYNIAVNEKGAEVNEKFDPNSSSEADILKEAQRLHLEAMKYKQDRTGHQSATADEAVLLGGGGQLVGTLTNSMNAAGSTINDRGNLLAQIISAKEEIAKKPIKLADASAEVKAWKEQVAALGDPTGTYQAASDKKKELQAQLDILNKQLEANQKINKITGETEKAKLTKELQDLAEKQEKEQEAIDKKKAKEDAKIRFQAVSDSITKIGGGGYVGTRGGTLEERIARAVEESAKAAKEGNVIQKKILDKKPVYE